MKKIILYRLVLTVCLAGFVWLALAFKIDTSGSESFAGLCLFKQATTLPCPACGTTRSSVALLKGDFSGVISANPAGSLLLIPLLLFPLWIIFDFIFGRISFWRFYHCTESILKKRWVYIPVILLIISNWVWNIIKVL